MKRLTFEGKLNLLQQPSDQNIINDMYIKIPVTSEVNWKGWHNTGQAMISIFSLHFDIHLLDFVVPAYPTKCRLTIGNSHIDLLLIQRDLLF